MAVGGQGVLFHRKEQGLRAYRVRRRRWQGVSDSKQTTEAHPKALGSARMKAALWNRRKLANREPAKAIERPSGDGESSDGDESLGLEAGAQGALSQPE